MAERPTRKPSAQASGRSTVDPALPHKKRARRRVIGAAALLLVTAIVLPLVLESEPRSPTPDLVMKIPPRDVEPAVDAASDAAPIAAPPIAEPLGGGAAAATGDARAADTSVAERPVGGSKGTEQKAAVDGKTVDGKTVDGKTVDAYWVQVGAFRSEEAAARAADSVRAAGLSTRAEKVPSSGGSVTRVRVGPFRDRDAASRARDQLKSRGVEAAIIAP